VGKPEGRRKLDRPRGRWEYFKMYLQEIKYDETREVCCTNRGKERCINNFGGET